MLLINSPFSLQSFDSDNDLKNHDSSAHAKSRAKCKNCSKVFIRNGDLEVHIENEHKDVVKFDCTDCKMTFALEWRLRKHTQMHTEEILSFLQ